VPALQSLHLTNGHTGELERGLQSSITVVPPSEAVSGAAEVGEVQSVSIIGLL